MPSVKFLTCAIPALFLIQGCADSQLARFAPPGIIKYEDIASEKPQSPEIQARIAERRADPDAGSFPRLAQTPSTQDRPQRLSDDVLEGQREALIASRETLAQQSEEDRIAAEADQAIAEALASRRDELKEKVDEDAALSARERAEQSLSPVDEK